MLTTYLKIPLLTWQTPTLKMDSKEPEVLVWNLHQWKRAQRMLPRVKVPATMVAMEVRA
jgi:hypothetical protein